MSSSRAAPRDISWLDKPDNGEGGVGELDSSIMNSEDGAGEVHDEALRGGEEEEEDEITGEMGDRGEADIPVTEVNPLASPDFSRIAVDSVLLNHHPSPSTLHERKREREQPRGVDDRIVQSEKVASENVSIELGSDLEETKSSSFAPPRATGALRSGNESKQLYRSEAVDTLLDSDESEAQRVASRMVPLPFSGDTAHGKDEDRTAITNATGSDFESGEGGGEVEGEDEGETVTTPLRKGMDLEATVIGPAASTDYSPSLFKIKDPIAAPKPTPSLREAIKPVASESDNVAAKEVSNVLSAPSMDSHDLTSMSLSSMDLLHKAMLLYQRLFLTASSMYPQHLMQLSDECGDAMYTAVEALHQTKKEYVSRYISRGKSGASNTGVKEAESRSSSLGADVLSDHQPVASSAPMKEVIPPPPPPPHNPSPLELATSLLAPLRSTVATGTYSDPASTLHSLPSISAAQVSGTSKDHIYFDPALQSPNGVTYDIGGKVQGSSNLISQILGEGSNTFNTDNVSAKLTDYMQNRKVMDDYGTTQQQSSYGTANGDSYSSSSLGNGTNNSLGGFDQIHGSSSSSTLHAMTPSPSKLYNGLDSRAGNVSSSYSQASPHIQSLMDEVTRLRSKLHTLERTPTFLPESVKGWGTSPAKVVSSNSNMSHGVDSVSNGSIGHMSVGGGESSLSNNSLKIPSDYNPMRVVESISHGDRGGASSAAKEESSRGFVTRNALRNIATGGYNGDSVDKSIASISSSTVKYLSDNNFGVGSSSYTSPYKAGTGSHPLKGSASASSNRSYNLNLNEEGNDTNDLGKSSSSMPRRNLEMSDLSFSQSYNNGDSGGYRPTILTSNNGTNGTSWQGGFVNDRGTESSNREREGGGGMASHSVGVSSRHQEPNGANHFHQPTTNTKMGGGQTEPGSHLRDRYINSPSSIYDQSSFNGAGNGAPGVGVLQKDNNKGSSRSVYRDYSIATATNDKSSTFDRNEKISKIKSLLSMISK